jgi:hypothetical protein
VDSNKRDEQKPVRQFENACFVQRSLSHFVHPIFTQKTLTRCVLADLIHSIR